MNHVLDIHSNGSAEILENEIFNNIKKGNTILFLGAGASVSDSKKYLSKELMTYSSQKFGLSVETDDIVEYIDILSTNKNFNRDKFDELVTHFLKKIKPSISHEIISSLPWKEIITTNYDLLLERSFDKVYDTHNQGKLLKVIKNEQDLNYRPSIDEVKYIKLNGCISDRSKHPLVFSSKDFERANRYYKSVLNSLENLSPRIQFLSVGYSFSDPFAKILMNKFDKYNFRGKRWIVNIDPFVNEDLLPYFTENKIQIIKCKSDEFFQLYKKNENLGLKYFLKQKNVQFKNRNNTSLKLPISVKARLADNITQLSDFTNDLNIKPKEYYEGAEPNYKLILNDHDVKHNNKLRSTIDIIKGFLAENDSDLIPLIFLKGSYGTGKTTFSYRIIKELQDEDEEIVALEIIEPTKIQTADLVEVIKEIENKKLILFFNNVEIHSKFNAIKDLQVRLSAEQITSVNIIFLSSIRENIYEKFTKNRDFIDLNVYEIDSPFSEDEAIELVNKLDQNNLLNVRDINERNRIVKKIINEYDGDSFVSLLSIVTNNNHSKLIEDAYQQLNTPAREAFIFTSLLYRYKILMPSNLLNKITLNDWDKFRKDILEYDAKGILIQTHNNESGSEPDIFFKTRHSTISEILIKRKFPSKDARFKIYQRLFNKISHNYYNSNLVVDILKSLRNDSDLTALQMDKLFDTLSINFTIDPHFNLHYAKNLQYRNSSSEKEKNLKKAIKRIVYSEGGSTNRNHYLVHRRAVLNFELAKLYKRKGRKHADIISFINESRDLFKIKLIEDPFSSFSFVDFLNFEIWVLKKCSTNKEEVALQHVVIIDLLDRANRQVISGKELIARIEADYYKNFQNNDTDINEYIEELCSEESTRHYGLMLRYYSKYDSEAPGKVFKTVVQLEQYLHFEEVSKILFSYYGRTLYVPDHRDRLYQLADHYQETLYQDHIRYHFFLAIADAYNYKFLYCYNHIKKIKNKFKGNPFLQDEWKDLDGKVKLFEAVLIQNKNHFNAKIIEFQQSFSLRRKNYSGSGVNLSTTQKYLVKLNFYTGGINAEIVKQL